MCLPLQGSPAQIQSSCVVAKEVITTPKSLTSKPSVNLSRIHLRYSTAFHQKKSFDAAPSLVLRLSRRQPIANMVDKSHATWQEELAGMLILDEYVFNKEY